MDRRWSSKPEFLQVRILPGVLILSCLFWKEEVMWSLGVLPRKSGC